MTLLDHVTAMLEAADVEVDGIRRPYVVDARGLADRIIWEVENWKGDGDEDAR